MACGEGVKSAAKRRYNKVTFETDFESLFSSYLTLTNVTPNWKLGLVLCYIVNLVGGID